MRTLSNFAPDYEILETVINAYLELSDQDEMIYDNRNDRCISVDDARNVVEQLKDLEEMCA